MNKEKEYDFKGFTPRKHKIKPDKVKSTSNEDSQLKADDISVPNWASNS